jgi:GNAT superfamily N-acetyltransferase
MSTASLGTAPVLRRAVRGDSAALCILARRCPQGRRLRFYHHREDYWERCRLQADAEVFVLESAGALAGTVSVARKSLWVQGSRQPAAYLFDLMVDPRQRGRGLAHRLLQAGRDACPGSRLFYSYILEDNRASRRLFESAGFTPHPRRLLYHPLLPRLARRRPPRRFRFVRRGEPAFADLADCLFATLPGRYDFLDATAGHDGLFVLEGVRGSVWAALRRHEPQVFVGLPWYAALVGRLLPLLPSPGRPVRAWTLHHLGSNVPAPRSTWRRFLAAVAWVAARAGVDAVAVPLFENDPHTLAVAPATLTGWGVPPGVTRLLVAGELAEQVLGTSRPLLLNGQDA